MSIPRPKSLLDRAGHLPGALLAALSASCVGLIIYLFTLAPDLTWAHYGGDGGELITAAVTFGIPHPPGYPTYVIAGKLWSLLPVGGSLAWKFNLFSAVAMAIAAGFAASTIFALSVDGRRNWLWAAAGGTTLALMPLVWSQALVAETYALNLMLLSALLWMLLGRRSSLWAGVLMGLSVTTHLSSLLYMPLAIALTENERRPRFFGGVFLGLGPLFILPLLSQGRSPVIWGDPSTLGGWWWLVSGQIYQANLGFGNVLNWPDLISDRSAGLLEQFAWAGWLLVILGVATWSGKRRDLYWLLATASAYILFSLLYQTDDAANYLLPGLLCLSVVAGVGLTRFGIAAWLFPLMLLILNGQHVSLRTDPGIRPVMETALLSVPNEAIVVTPGDSSIFSLWYFHHVEGQRSDLVLVDENLLAFDWYRERLLSRHPALLGLEKDDFAHFVQLNRKQQPLCLISLAELSQVSCMEREA